MILDIFDTLKPFFVQLREFLLCLNRNSPLIWGAVILFVVTGMAGPGSIINGVTATARLWKYVFPLHFMVAGDPLAILTCILVGFAQEGPYIRPIERPLLIFLASNVRIDQLLNIKLDKLILNVANRTELAQALNHGNCVLKRTSD